MPSVQPPFTAGALPFAPAMVEQALSVFGVTLTYHRQTGEDFDIVAMIGGQHADNDDREEGFYLSRRVSFVCRTADIRPVNIMDTLEDENGTHWMILAARQYTIAALTALECERSDKITRFRRQEVTPIPVGDTGIIGQGIIGQTYRIGH